MWVVTRVENNYETSEIIGPFNTEAQARSFANQINSEQDGSLNYGVEKLADPNALRVGGDTT